MKFRTVLAAYAVACYGCGKHLPAPPSAQNAVCAGQVNDACPLNDVAECEKRCDCGDLRSCQMVGAMYTMGPVGPVSRPWEVNASRATTAFRRACDGGWGAGCTALGLAYQRNGSVEEARVALTRAGAFAHSHGCMRLGLLVKDADRTRALEALRRSCELADAEGCWAFADMLLGETSKGDRDEALSALADGCNKGTALSTDEFSLARARRFVEKACAKLHELEASPGSGSGNVYP